MGPICEAGSLAGPTCSAATRAASFCANTSCTLRCTKTRLGHTQVWPPLRNLAAMKPSTAASMSASSKTRSEEHTSELQSQSNLVCRLLLEKKKKKKKIKNN